MVGDKTGQIFSFLFANRYIILKSDDIDVTAIIKEVINVQSDLERNTSRLPLNYDTFQRRLKSMDTEFDRSVGQSLLASFLTRDNLYHLGIKPDKIVGNLTPILEASTETENAVVAADGLMNCRLKDRLNKIKCKEQEIQKKLQHQALSEKTKSDLHAELELCKLRANETNALLNKETTRDANKFNRARKRVANQLLDENRVKEENLGLDDLLPSTKKTNTSLLNAYLRKAPLMAGDMIQLCTLIIE